MTGAKAGASASVLTEKKEKTSLGAKLLNAPYLLWSAVFIVVPILMVVFYAFSETVGYYEISFTAGGREYVCELPAAEDLTLEGAKEQAAAQAGVSLADATFTHASLEYRSGGFTLANLKEVWSPASRRAMLLSFLYSLAATAISLVIAYPFAYALSRSGAKSQRIQMLLIMLPMWMNMLVRTYSWQQILENNGVINKALAFLGLGPATMLGTSGAVILGMVYNYLPYMILPIYTVMSKIDVSLLEAADDLGCNWLQKLWRLILPLSVPGIISGLIMVFVPSISTFYISQKMSNGMIKLVGDLIESKIKDQWAGGGLNVGAAMSLVLMVIILVCTFVMNRFSDDDGGGMVV
ncbi:MAG: ABC transporter permease [Clostridia bacterium]|nr:ABC transporter permease [Clostridia bacterium]